MAFNYFDIAHAIETHDFIIDESGGSHGIRDIGLLESVLDHIQNDLYYPEFETKVAHLVFSVNKSHAFSDGNKRSSIALGAYFLELNGLDYCLDRFIIEMENISVHVADNRIDKDLLYEIIYSIINEDDFSEELRIKIIDATNQQDN
ncbi:type II toxin-antitoxin system death-on-curing family toxin [Flagellimonas lutimaris]|uniref:Type II toxin-antitoxin system death-on-curing family toxin n=1 Tax=Flagellimonas lutimaris TaxID=475082 RepID=A0A3A1N6Y6_9FLAO|nr:type II toxin-antitoxin system death-on-curing family toxin [Allomuricauda lutimaris]RIV31554.1 type II toxin-antitoxin system death-on-curing family toxin [Allomuricauda lutimaris]